MWKYNTWQPWLKQSGSFGKKIIIIFMNECNGMERNGTETGREGRRGRESKKLFLYYLEKRSGMERNGTETGREGRRGREIISILSGKKERNG